MDSTHNSCIFDYISGAKVIKKVETASIFLDFLTKFNSFSYQKQSLTLMAVIPILAITTLTIRPPFRPSTALQRHHWYDWHRISGLYIIYILLGINTVLHNLFDFISSINQQRHS